MIPDSVREKGYVYYEEPGIILLRGDCLEILPLFEPKSFDLVLTDPPYGIGADKNKRANTQYGNAVAPSKDYGIGNWDNDIINQIEMDRLIKCSEYSCVWGGNYYTFHPSPSWLVWDKETGNNGYADCELAWTNYGSAVRLIKHQWMGMLRKGNEQRYHPTQKPLEVIKWAAELSPKADTILDPFGGSCTTAVAAKQLGRKCVVIELEKKYLDIGIERLQQEVLF
jgi:DNA modification methylase